MLQKNSSRRSSPEGTSEEMSHRHVCCLAHGVLATAAPDAPFGWPLVGETDVFPPAVLTPGDFVSCQDGDFPRNAAWGPPPRNQTGNPEKTTVGANNTRFLVYLCAIVSNNFVTIIPEPLFSVCD